MMTKFEVQAPLRARLRPHAGEWFYSHFRYGSNYRLSEWQGAILNVQLSRLDEQTKRRHQNSRLLDRLLCENSRYYTAKAGRTVHAQWAVCLHFPRE